MDDICTQPTDTTGYVVTNNVLNAEGFDVSVSCATGYEGEPSVSACSESGPYTLEGCSPIMCELPELEYPILRNYGQSQNLSMGENFNLVSMCLQIDGISDTGVVLHESCTADNRIVEVSECELNTGYFYGPLQGIPVACASVENSAADATLTCTSLNDSRVESCNEGYYKIDGNNNLNDISPDRCIPNNSYIDGSTQLITECPTDQVPNSSGDGCEQIPNQCHFNDVNMDAYQINQNVIDTINDNLAEIQYFKVDDVPEILCSEVHETSGGGNQVTHTCPENNEGFVLTECLPIPSEPEEQCIGFPCPEGKFNIEGPGNNQDQCCMANQCHFEDVNMNAYQINQNVIDTINDNLAEIQYFKVDDVPEILCSEDHEVPTWTGNQVTHTCPENNEGFVLTECLPIPSEPEEQCIVLPCPEGKFNIEGPGNNQDQCCMANQCHFEDVNMNAYQINQNVIDTINDNLAEIQYFKVDDVPEILCSEDLYADATENYVTHTCPENNEGFVLTECLPIPSEPEEQICESNQIVNQENQCMNCPNGQQPNPDSTECIECDSGLTGNDGYCNFCPSNHRWNGLNCEVCQDGKYSPSMEVNDRDNDVWECSLNLCNPILDPSLYPGYEISDHDNSIDINVECALGYNSVTAPPNIICTRSELETELNDFLPPTGCEETTDQCIGNFNPDFDFYNFYEMNDLTSNVCPINKTVRVDLLNADEEKNIENCCIDRTGFCINNIDTSENYTEYGDNTNGDDKMCPEFHRLERHPALRAINGCCIQKTGHCIDNFDSSENYREFEENPDNENGEWDTLPEKMCGRVYNLTTNSNRKIDEGCCDERFDYCIDNWDSSIDIICNTRTHFEDNPNIDRNTIYSVNDETISNQEALDNAFSQCCLEINNRCSDNENSANDVRCSDYGERFRGRENLGGVCINDNNGLVYLNDGNEIEISNLCTSDDENINLSWLPYDEIRYNDDEEKQNYCCYEINDNDYSEIINCQTDFQTALCQIGESNLTNKTDEEIEDNDYSNYESLSLEEKQNMCCKPRVNFCYNNADTENNPNVVCPDNYDILPLTPALNLKCLNDENEEIRCSELFEQDDGENKVYSQCCLERTGFCSYNTNPSNDIVCEGSSTLKVNALQIEGTTQDECCNVNQMCTGNDVSSMDVDCNGEYQNKRNIIGRCLGDADVILSNVTTETECVDDGNNWLNSSEIIKDSMNRSEEENCCDIATNM